MKGSKKTVTLNNLIFPLWLLVWLPSWLWLIIIPANYIIDRLVFTFSGKKQKPELSNTFFRNETWKLWLIGFGVDFIGSVILLIPTIIEMIAESIWPDTLSCSDMWDNFQQALSYNCFRNVGALLYAILAVAVAGVLIYIFDKKAVLKMGEFTEEQAHKVALSMAIFTAPYLYLVPMELFM